MANKLTLKDHRNEASLFNRRAIAVLVIVLLFAGTLIGRLFYLQVTQHHFYTTMSNKNILNIIPIEPRRGLIYDRNGVLLAKNVRVFSLNLIPNQIKNTRKTITQLKKIINITPQDIKIFKHSLKIHMPFQPVTLVPKLTQQEVARFYVNSYRFPGVSVRMHLLRYYPLGKTTSNVVGYVGRINAQELATVNHVNYSASDDIGKTGIEAYFEKKLHGHVGAEEVEINAEGHIIRVIRKIPPTPGENIDLTIDSKLQAFAEKQLGKNAGSIVAIQPATGQVLALVTNPDYNPNPFVTGISEKAFNALLHASQHPLYDRAIRGLYSPGSTIKPFYAIGGLNDGIITPSYDIFDPGWFRLPGTEHVFHDWKYNGHGWVNVKKAIMVSCDTFFYNLAANAGIGRMDDTLHHFGFGQATGIDLPNELPGIVPSPAWKKKTQGKTWYTGDTIVAGIGQGSLLITPLQLAEATAIIAERGKHLQPQLVLKTIAPDKQVINVAPKKLKPYILRNPHIWTTVIRAMEGVITNPIGTAEFFGRHPGYTAAAKTGTAQIFGHQRDEERSNMFIPKKLRNNHLFIVFAPVNHPQIALSVVVEHASFADEIARHVVDFYFKQLKQQQVAKEREHGIQTDKLLRK